MIDLYDKQLETLLFSINQYSEDYVRTWVKELTEVDNIVGTDLPGGLNEFTVNYPSIKAVYKLDINDTTGNLEVSNTDVNSKKLSNFINNNKSLVDRLFSYQTKGYTKIKPISISKEPNTVFLLFPISFANERRLNVIKISSPEFISRIIAPKI